MDFTGAYALLTHEFNPADAVTGRIDWFETKDHAPRSGGYAFANPVASPRNEDGWALTAAYKHTFTPNAAVFIEAMHVWSDRQARILTGAAAEQSQTVHRPPMKGRERGAGLARRRGASATWVRRPLRRLKGALGRLRRRRPKLEGNPICPWSGRNYPMSGTGRPSSICT